MYQDLPEIPEREWSGDFCECCKYKIYAGDVVYCIAGNFYHQDCLADMSGTELAEALGRMPFEVETFVPEPEKDELWEI